MSIALLRGVSPSLARCELTFLERQPIDLDRAVAQHRGYARTLEGLGLTVVELPADAELPDCCFVEDTAVVLDELAVIASPGSAARRGELPAVRPILEAYRPVASIEPPARLDGGDVLRVGRRLFVGLSSRTDRTGVEALARLAAPFGYSVLPVSVDGCLHLKSAVTALDPETLLVNPDWIELAVFDGFETVAVAPGEPAAANVLRVGDVVLAADAFPHTAERIDAAGFELVTLDVSEFLKAEAGLTCKSLIFAGRPGAA